MYVSFGYFFKQQLIRKTNEQNTAEYVNGALASFFSKSSVAGTRSAVNSSPVMRRNKESESWSMSSVI